MNLNNFVELSGNELLNVDGGSWIGNTLILAGGVVCGFATGPVGIGAGVAIAVIGFCDTQGW